MAQSCTANDLANAAKCLNGFSPIWLKSIQVALLCNMVNGTNMDCDASTLANAAKCYTGMTVMQLDAIIVFLLCLFNGSGGVSGQIVTYTSGTPANPANTALSAIAYDPTGNLPLLGWSVASQGWF